MAVATVSRPWSIKRRRRTRAQVRRLRVAIYQLLEEQHPQADRQLFYAMTVRGLIAKEESDYKNVVVRQLGLMREQGELPWAWIVDGTRWMRKPPSHSSIEEALEETRRTYRRALWDEQDAYCEIWVEKEGLAGVIYPITAEFDVPLMPVKGFPSKGFVHSAAETIAAQGKPAYIYYFGDWDPSGLLIGKDLEAKFARYAPDAEIYFERIAITPQQIERYQLPSRPTKRHKNTHAKNFEGDSVELDALPAQVLRDLVRSCIERHIGPWQLEVNQRVEESEREAWNMFRNLKQKPPDGDPDDPGDDDEDESSESH